VTNGSGLAPSDEDEVQRDIRLGITDDAVPLGSHLLYFWQNDEEFERGVRFLEAGLDSSEHCVLQGHDEVNEKTLKVLEAHGFDPARLIADNRLIVLGRRPTTEMLTDMAAVFESALRMGARAIRYLGNLGLTGEPLPGVTESDICNLEARTTSYISRLPCVLVCMYDVRSLPGRMIVNCGLRNHPQTIGSGGMQENPHYMPPEQALPGLRCIH
jgi:MEDS: MEthanogen/methylotroph, DcmR Sensory domain